MKASYLILPNIDPITTTFLLYIQLHTDSRHSLWYQSCQKFSTPFFAQFLQRYVNLQCEFVILLYKNISNVHIRGKFKKIMRIQKSSD